MYVIDTFKTNDNAVLQETRPEELRGSGFQMKPDQKWCTGSVDGQAHEGLTQPIIHRLVSEVRITESLTSPLFVCA